MLVPFTEPTAPRYIYINPDNNLVHLLVPIVGGVEISTDNTCKSTKSLDDFFSQGAALNELSIYKSALEFDLQFLDYGNELKIAKKQRLNQIKKYIKAVSAMKNDYEDAITVLMKSRSNLYSIQLRPQVQDPESLVINPVFSINRKNDKDGTPLSALYNAMHKAYPNTKIADLNSKAQLVKAVLSVLSEQEITFKVLQQTLAEQSKKLFDLEVDFTKDDKGIAINQADIDELMGFTSDTPGTTEDYIDALLGTCALTIFETIPLSPFYTILDDEYKTEKLSILTQFFLAQVNIYCVTNKISNMNFGTILDVSDMLSEDIVDIVCSALEKGEAVEECLAAFCIKNQEALGLSRELSQGDINFIKKQFSRTYTTVTATKENPHMDDFMILNTTTTDGKFVIHQGSICTDLTEFTNDSLGEEYFKTIRSDFEAQYVPVIPHKNEHIKASFELDMGTLISHIEDDKQFKKLSIEIQQICLKSPVFQLLTFLHGVAKGKQDEKEQVLKEYSEAQDLLTSPGIFTDYSGRTFNCTAYEYAYWAKDRHMCRMLEKYMDENTKEQLLKRCEAIEEDGLKYMQNDKEYCSKHFDLTPLKKALEEFVEGYNNWRDKSNWDAMKLAWMKVGLAQRDVPVHVINEYCRLDRSFKVTPEFNEDKLPRVVTFYQNGEQSLFPLDITMFSGLGVSFGLTGSLGWRNGATAVSWGFSSQGAWLPCSLDWAAICSLDKVRTEDVKQSLDNLKPKGSELGL